MKKQEQRIAIAEACGWENINDLWIGNVSGTTSRERVPDYLNDLNAMHEAEKVLDDSWEAVPPRQCGLYIGQLCENNPMISQYGLIHATAAQRAEAFLKTLNLWDEVDANS